MLKSIVNDDGSTSVEVTIEKQKKSKDVQTRKWFCGNATQALKHVATWNHKDLPESERLSKGDSSALQDRLHEIRKQRKS